jgi:hypothetical protein
MRSGFARIQIMIEAMVTVCLVTVFELVVAGGDGACFWD